MFCILTDCTNNIGFYEKIRFLFLIILFNIPLGLITSIMIKSAKTVILKLKIYLLTSMYLQVVVTLIYSKQNVLILS